MGMIYLGMLFEPLFVDLLPSTCFVGENIIAESIMKHFSGASSMNMLKSSKAVVLNLFFSMDL